MEIETPAGLARAHVDVPEGATAALVLGHGAGGGITAPDIQATKNACLRRGIATALVEQPYRVAGRRSPAPAPRLDEAWISVVEQLPLKGLPIATGGRSSGARVACRTAAATGSRAVVCLAFPLEAPSGKSRQDELDLPGVPVLVIQGVNDRFGMPEPTATRTIVQVEGDHALRKGVAAIGETVAGWLAQQLAA